MKLKTDYQIGDKIVLKSNLLGYDVPTKGWIGTVQYNHVDYKKQNVVIIIDRVTHKLRWYISYSNLKPLIMKYKQFENAVGEKIFNILGEWNTKRATICKKCYNKRMGIENTVSHIILNS